MQKKILVITHQLSRTGAPIVLLDMIKIYQKNGYQIEVISMMDGELRIEVEQLQIPVIIMDGFMDRPTAFLEKARSFDLVIANTLLTYEAIHILNGTEMPVIWWLHEGEQYFEYFASVLPDFSGLSPNVHVYSVGHYVQKVIQKRYGILTDILHFGVRDVPESEIKSRDRRKFRFLIVGTYSNVKAQDVLAHAVRRLPDKVIDQAEFYFYGNDENYDKEVYAAVVSLEKDYPNVFMSSLLPHEQLLERMENSDCLIVPSRVDPIPTVAVEMMMKERLCLCTDVCGIAHYIQDGWNGFTVEPENVQQLADKICYIVGHQTDLQEISERGRMIFENYFSEKVFVPKILGMAERFTSVLESNRKKRCFSVCMIAKNEERHIRRALQSLLCLQAEMIVVDTGSSDQTKTIAREFTSNVYDYTWNDDFAAAKNFALSKASGEFVWFFDADEYLEPLSDADIEKLQNQILTNRDKVGRVICRNIFEIHGNQPESREFLSRIFNKNEFCYRGKIHEQVVKRDGSDFETYQTGISFLHSGYDLSEEERQEKAERNLKLLKAALEQGDNKEDEEAYLMYQIGKTYYLKREYETACEYFSKGLSFDLNPKLEYVIDMVETFGYALLNSGQAQAALAFEGIYDTFGGTSDFKFLMGLIYMNNEMFDEAVSEFRKAAETGEGRTPGTGSYLANYNIGVIYECLGDTKQAYEFYRLCGDYAPAKKRLEGLA